MANCVGGWECVYKRYECELFISNAADLGTNTKVASLLNQRTVGNCGLDIAIQKLTLDFMMGRFGSPSDVSSRHKRATRTLFASIHTTDKAQIEDVSKLCNIRIVPTALHSFSTYQTDLIAV